jgi:hypothetical protein
LPFGTVQAQLKVGFFGGAARHRRRSAGILPAYDMKSPALAKSKKSPNRIPNPQSRLKAGAPATGASRVRRRGLDFWADFH